jgi:large subunit ribosomal protein L17
MRHRKLSRRFSRTSSHRTAMMRNLAISLIEHEIVKTTVEKGKYLRTFLEPLITKSKKDTLNNRRKVISSLNSQTAASKLFSDISPKLSDTNGGYLRIIKAGFRPGDKADMCFVELTCRDPEKSLSDTTLEDNTITSPEISPVSEQTQTKDVSETDAIEKETKKPISKKKEEKKPVPKKEATKKDEEKEPAPKKEVAQKVEAKKTAPKKEAAQKVEAKKPAPKKEEKKESWWKRFVKNPFR